MNLRYVDLAGFKATPLTREPFEFLSLPGFLNAEACAEINRDYPKIAESGSFPVAQVVSDRLSGNCSMSWAAMSSARPSKKNSPSI